MKVSFDGIGEKLVTFISSGVQAGDPVKVSAAGTVSTCAAGERFDGIALYAEDGCAGVRLGGFVTAEYSGTAPAVGRARLVADGEGGIKLDAGTAHTLTEGSDTYALTEYTGSEYLIVDKDAAAGTVTFIM